MAFCVSIRSGKASGPARLWRSRIEHAQFTPAPVLGNREHVEDRGRARANEENPDADAYAERARNQITALLSFATISFRSNESVPRNALEELSIDFTELANADQPLLDLYLPKRI